MKQLFVLLIVLCPLSKAFAVVESALPVFELHRSTNKNYLVYEARVEMGEFTEQDPIRAHWINKETGGDREELNVIERNKVYGVTVRKRTPESVIFALKALPTRVMEARMDPKTKATGVYIKVAGKDCLLSKVYLDLEEKGLNKKIKKTTYTCLRAPGSPGSDETYQIQENGPKR